MDLVIHVPDALAERVRRLPDVNRFALEAIERALTEQSGNSAQTRRNRLLDLLERTDGTEDSAKWIAELKVSRTTSDLKTPLA